MDAVTSTGTPTLGRMEPRRMVGVALFLLALAGGMFLSHVAAAILHGVRWNDPSLLGVEELTLSTLIGFALAVAGAAYCWFDPKVRTAALDVATELKKVTWPSIAETRVSTVAVIVASVVSALVLFSFDFVSSKVMTVWVPSALGWIARI
jgi:preprotein translocase subunit SecE